MAVNRLILQIGFAVLWGAVIGLAPALRAEAPSESAGPSQPAAAEPPWQRMLAGDDAKRAADLEQKIAELRRTDQWAKAQELARQVLELRTRAQGADHDPGDSVRKLDVRDP